MADKARHAFGALEQVDSAISEGKIDAFDILFVKNAEGKPYVGWVDRDGNKVIVDDSAELEELETKIATKATTEEVDEKLAAKADTVEVDEKINTAVTDTVATAKSYTDGKVKAAIAEHLTKKYEVDGIPEGTLIKMSDSEIRIMCPSDAVFTKQNVGTGGDANCYYMTLKTYVYDDNVVGYREHLGDQVDAEILTDLKTDEYGRRYQPTWLALAKHDETTGAWNYYGKNSTNEKYVGWDYQIDFYDANGKMVASDSIRINLSNESCHSFIEPYYVGGIMKEVDVKIETKIDEKIDEKIAEVSSAYEVIEF